METNLLQNGRRRWMWAGTATGSVSLVLIVALFTTSLERRLLSGFLWFLVVSALFTSSAVSLLLVWRVRSDRLGLTALALGLVAALVLAGFILFFLLVSSLSGLH
jgi:anti-sigma-K factor RskA